jgi:DNA-binding CsgD family transcriptional regulator
MHLTESALRKDVASSRARAASVGPASLPLSPREQEVLGLLARGLSYQECASVLGVGRETVKTLVKRTLRKLDATCTREAIAIAFREGNIT